MLSSAAAAFLLVSFAVSAGMLKPASLPRLPELTSLHFTSPAGSGPTIRLTLLPTAHNRPFTSPFNAHPHAQTTANSTRVLAHRSPPWPPTHNATRPSTPPLAAPQTLHHRAHQPPYPNPSLSAPPQPTRTSQPQLPLLQQPRNPAPTPPPSSPPCTRTTPPSLTPPHHSSSTVSAGSIWKGGRMRRCFMLRLIACC